MSIRTQCTLPNMYFFFLIFILHVLNFMLGPQKSRAPRRPGKGSFLRWNLILSAQLMQPFISNAKICINSHAPKKKAPDIRKEHRPFYSCGPSVWNLLHLTFLALRIWNDSLIFVNLVDPCSMLCPATFRHVFYLESPSIFSSLYLYQFLQLLAIIVHFCLKYSSSCAFTNCMCLARVSRKT